MSFQLCNSEMHWVWERLKKSDVVGFRRDGGVPAALPWNRSVGITGVFAYKKWDKECKVTLPAANFKTQSRLYFSHQICPLLSEKTLNVLMKYFKKYILVALLMKSTIFIIKDRNTVKNILLLFKKLRMRLAFLCIINLTLMLTRLPTPGYCSQISFRAMLSKAFICPACQYYQKPSLNIDLLSRLFSQEPCEERIPSSASCYGQEMVKSAPPHSVLIYTLHLTA